jgi:hypothetical protein
VTLPVSGRNVSEKIRFSTVSKYYDNCPNSLELPKDEFFRLVTCVHVDADKFSAPLFVPAVFSDFCRRRGCECGDRAHKLDENIERITALVFEYDAVPVGTFDELHARLREDGVEHFLYTSHGHAPPEHEKFRLVVFLTRPLRPGKEFDTSWARLHEALGVKADGSGRVESRGYFVHSCPPGRESDARALYSPGLPLDVDAFLGVEQAVTSTPTNVVADSPAVKEKVDAWRAELLDGNDALLRTVAGGRPFAAQPGETPVGPWDRGREPSLTAVMYAVRKACRGITEDEALELIRPSLEAVRSEMKDKPPAYLSEKKVRERFRSADRKLSSEEKIHDEFLGAVHKGAEASAANRPKVPNLLELSGNTEVVTPDLLREVSEKIRCTPEEVARRLIITTGDKHHVLDTDGRYVELSSDSALKNLASHYLPKFGVQVTSFDGKRVKRFTNPELIERHGAHAHDVEMVMGLDYSHYDADTKTFRMSVCRPRNLTPTYHVEIQRWLEHLGGPKAGKLLDWCATVTDLQRLTGALVFEGPPSTGKSLFAAGIARLYTTKGFTESKAVIGTPFQENLLQCPIVFGDEFHGSTLELREFLGTTTRSINRKFRDRCTLIGAPRVILASNNPKFFRVEDEITEQDMRATALRFIHIHVSQQAAEYLREIGGAAKVHDWIEQDMLAEHVLYLIESRRVDTGNRFLVEGEVDDFHLSMLLQNPIMQEICEWIMGLLANPAPMNSEFKHTYLVGNGECLLNPDALKFGWEFYLKNSKQQPTPRISDFLQILSHKVETREVPPSKHGEAPKLIKFFNINMERVFSFAEKKNIGNIAAAKATLDQRVVTNKIQQQSLFVRKN